jgi:hypothetical protein
LVGDVAAALGAGAPSKCTARKLETAGKKARAKAECHAHATREGAQVDTDCVVQAEFSAGWARAEAKGDCVAPTGDKDAVEGRVDTFIADLASELGR